MRDKESIEKKSVHIMLKSRLNSLHIIPEGIYFKNDQWYLNVWNVQTANEIQIPFIDMASWD